MTNRFSSRLDRPRFWGWGYISSIFIFAVLYGLTGVPLTQSTATADKNFQSAQSTLEFQIAHYVRNATGDRFLVFPDATLSGTGEEVVISLTVLAAGDSARGIRPTSSTWTAMVRRNHALQFSAVTPGIVVTLRPSEQTIAQSRTEADLGALSRTIEDFRRALAEAEGKRIRYAFDESLVRSSNEDSIELTGNAIYIAFESVASELDGTLRADSSWIRLLYFSAVTATTLGYGDIVPVSDEGRLLVIIQTILSMVLIGLFLNSLAHLSSKRPAPN